MGLRTRVKEWLFGKPKLIVTLTTEPPIKPIASSQPIASVVLPKPIVPALVKPLGGAIDFPNVAIVSPQPIDRIFDAAAGEWSAVEALVKQNDELAEQWFDSGVQKYAQGDFSGAIQDLEKAIEFKPDSYKAWDCHGNSLAELGRYEEAIISYEKLIEFKPDDYETWYACGVLLFSLGRYEEATVSYEKAIEFKADYSEALYGLGDSLNELGRYEEAIASYGKVIEFKPDYPEAWYSRGNSLYALERYEEAIASYGKAIEFNAAYPEAWYNHGNSLDQLGRYEEAIVSFDRAVELKSDYFEAWNNRGNSLDQLGRYEEAIVSFGKSVEFKPDNYQAWYGCGRSLSALDQEEEAIDSFNEALEFKPDLHEAWNNRGNSLALLFRYEEAITSFDKALKFKPDYYGVWHNRGISLGLLVRYEEAIASFDKALEFKSDYHEAWHNRGVAAANSHFSSPYPQPIILNQRPANLHQKHPELNQRGYNGQVASLTVGLTYCPADTHPLGHGDLQFELGNTHFKAEQWSRAAQAYQSALTVLTETDFPEERLLTLQQIIRLTLTQNNLPTARHYQLEGSKLYETLRTQAQDQRAFDRKFSTFRLTEIDLLIGENEPRRALEQAEFYKNRALTWLLDPPNPLKKGEQEPEADSTTLSTNPNHFKVPLPKGDLGGSIVYWHQSTDRITTFILTNDNAEPIILDCDRQQQYKRFIAWKTQWDKDYDDYRDQSKKSPDSVRAAHPAPFPPSAPNLHPWRQKMTDRLSTLRDILAIDQILTHLPIDHSLILIPHRDLHRYPIHALFDRPTIHSPSIQSIPSVRAAHPAPSSDRPSLLTIADPETDQPAMPYARLESALLQTLVRASHPAPLISALPPNNATLPQTLQTLQSPHQHFHFTGHGIHDAQHPNRSALQLTDALLTANTIAQLNLSHLDLAILAACETAIANPDDTSDYLGIQSAFLRAGTRTILSTLWNIDEIASTWFIVHFYQQILKGMKPAIALTQTQTWMQTLTWKTLTDWLTELRQLPSLSSDPYDRLTARIANILEKRDTMNELTDYHHPYYWSAFVLTGEG